jgi:hypothetical protein
MAELQARWHRAIAELPQEAWDTLLGDHAAAPFYRWRWLHRLEASGSIVPREGWQPCHLGLWRGGELVAAAPLYLKGHSYGEFVFDQSFAQLAGQRLKRGGAGARQRNGRALRMKRARHSASEAAGGAGDEGVQAGEIEHGQLLM